MMEKLKEFEGGYATEEETKAAIHDTYASTGYVMDTHTAVAAHVSKVYREKSGDQRKMLIASTASPYKFVGSVMSAIDEKYQGQEDFDLINELERVSGTEIPHAINEIRNAEIMHTLECDIDAMKETVKSILKAEE